MKKFLSFFVEPFAQHVSIVCEMSLKVNHYFGVNQSRLLYYIVLKSFDRVRLSADVHAMSLIGYVQHDVALCSAHKLYRALDVR